MGVDMLSRIMLKARHEWNQFQLTRSQRLFAERDSFQFIYDNHDRDTCIYDNQWALRDACISRAPSTGALMEFGVFKGNSINRFARYLKAHGDTRNLIGFDSFRGFSEVWSGAENEFPSERFDREGVFPSVEDNVELIDGYIEDTLQGYLDSSGIESVAFAHIDTDTYSPAVTALSKLKPFVVPGSVLLFDELCGYPNWRNHEYRALNEVFERGEYDYLGFGIGARRTKLISAGIVIK